MSGVGFSNGWAELTLKKPPPLVPSCLMAICEAAGPDGDHLLGDRLARRRPSVGCEQRHRLGTAGSVCTTPCDTSTSASTQRQRQQDVERAARQVDPEVADGLGRCCRAKPRIKRHQHGHARRRRDEVLHGQAQHLRQVAHRRLAAVALPVGVGGEADGGVERQSPASTAARPCGLQRQHVPAAAAGA